MGPPGGQAVTAQLRSELMGTNPALGNFGLTPHPSYYRDLLEVLKQHIAGGTVSIRDLEDLEKAAAGMKTGPQASLAQELQKTLAEVDDLRMLLNWAEQSSDSNRRQQLYGKARAKFDEATVSQLVQVLQSKADSVTKDAASRELDERWVSRRPAGAFAGAGERGGCSRAAEYCRRTGGEKPQVRRCQSGSSRDLEAGPLE